MLSSPRDRIYVYFERSLQVVVNVVQVPFCGHPTVNLRYIYSTLSQKVLILFHKCMWTFINSFIGPIHLLQKEENFSVGTYLA